MNLQQKPTTIQFDKSIKVLYNQEINKLIYHNQNFKKTIRKCQNINTKICNTKINLEYLYQHKNKNQIPNHIIHIEKKIEHSICKEYFQQNNIPSFLSSFSTKLLSLQIKTMHWKLSILEKEFKMNLQNINNPITTNILENICTSYITNQCKMKTNLLINKVKTRSAIVTPLLNKNNQLEKYNNLHTNNWCINITELNIPNNIINFLSLGHNFNINNKTKNKDFKNIIVDLEYALKITESNINIYEMRNNINNIITNYINKTKKQSHLTPIEKQINIDAKDTKTFIKNNSNLIITKADKCNTTVIMTIQQYQEKMNDHLNNRQTYIKIRKQPCEKIKEIKKEYNNILNDLLKKKYINQIEKTKLNINNCNIARIQGLPKLHKDKIPIRPIINGINSPTEQIAKFLNPTLNNLNNNNKYDIKNAFELKDKLRNIEITNDDRLISLDIISLFTSIPLNNIYKIIMKNWELIEPYTTIKCKNTYINIIKFICNNNYFTYNNELYRQINGTPMGGKMSSNLSGIVVNSILDEFFQNSNIKPKYICKYVDDIFLIINKNECDIILNEINKINKNIQFTMEKETNEQINYLDITIIRNKNTLKTKWYEKNIKNKQILNFLSHHPISQKINTIKNLINRAIKLTDLDYIKETKTYIFNKLNKNLYPNRIIKKHWNTIYHKQQTPNNNITNPPTKKYVSLTYIPEITNKINQLFKKESINDICFGHRPTNKIKQLYHTNTYDDIGKFKKNNVIYKINCENCDEIYIGETKQNLITRIQQHDYDIRTKKK